MALKDPLNSNETSELEPEEDRITFSEKEFFSF